MKKLVIYGVSPAAVQSHYDFTTDSDYQVAAFTVEQRDIKQPELLGVPVAPFETVESLYPPAEFDLFIAVYFNRVNQVRMRKFEQAGAKGYALARYVSSKAIVWPGLEIGENCMICDGANVRPFTRIGKDTFVMPGAVVGHDSVVGDHCYLAMHAVLLAGSVVESGCVIGANATVLNGVTVARDCVIGAGAVINRNTKEKGVYTVNEPTLQPLPSDKMANVLFKVQV
jgi:sugar O-acyltransferase (sialic acid O-acetyltransferase NeuD family)